MSIYEDLKPINLDEVSTYPLASRQSKVTVEDFATPVTENASLDHYLASLPNILAVQTLRELATQIRRARNLHKPIIWGIGGHVMKTRVGPSMIELLRRGCFSATRAQGMG